MAARPGLIALLLVCGACNTGETSSASTLPEVPLHGVWHRVQQGDRAADLARRYRVPLSDIVEINGVLPGETLQAGRELFIVGARPHTSPTPPAAAIAGGPPGGAGHLWPVRGGQVTSPFGRRDKTVHEGIDIAAPEGTAVLAVTDGVVMYAGSGVRGYGNLILIRHSGKLVTVYAHNRRNLVREGDRVSRGQVIAEVGHSGRATGSHLHFELRQGDTPVDPLPHLKRE